MTTDHQATAPGGQPLVMVWASMLISPLMIAVPLHLFAGVAGIGGLPADYDLWFLVGGLAAGGISLPLMRRFRDVVHVSRGSPREANYWHRVTAAMMAGLGVAELPFFIGLAGYLAGGYTQTAAILLVVTLALQTRFKPPGR